MQDYVNIKTVFNSSKQRTIDNLSKLYTNTDSLQSIVYELIKNELLLENKLFNKKIFLKPNWVTHSKKESDEICLRTNDNLLIALVRVILEQSPQSILIGDAPIQGCDWDMMIDNNFLSEIKSLSEKYKIPIIIKDFRRVNLDVENNKLSTNRKNISEYLIFDTERDSYLEPISTKRSNFRVTCYNPDRLAESHTQGIHKYCITKELFEADVIISVPKLKTHQKTGITGALKNLVGINGDKDYLPHHRIGGIGHGGDCYPGNNYFRLLSEKLLDSANRNIGKSSYKVWQFFSAVFWKLSNPKPVHQMAAGWYGNDTCWRMVMDLNRIAIYGKRDGTLSDTPQRILYSLCDGIIGGQGNGPLEPEPLPLGIVTFSNNSVITDICAATLMGFDINKINLLKNSSHQIKCENIAIILNNKISNIKQLQTLKIKTTPPPGWNNYL